MLKNVRLIIFDPFSCRNRQFKEEAVLLVDRLLMALDFVCAYFVCHDKLSWLYSIPQLKRLDKLEGIIIQMLVLPDLTSHLI